nr:hypothetical protein [Tanacetum cinerariifolium]
MQLHPHFHDQPKKVDSLGDHDSEDEVALVDNEMADFMASKEVGYGTNCLVEQGKETFENNNYNLDPYDDDMYECHDMSDKIQAIYDNLDIKEEVVHQRLWKTLTHVLELSSYIYLDDRAWGSTQLDVIRFPAQSISSSNTIALDSPHLLVLNTGASQNRQHGNYHKDNA